MKNMVIEALGNGLMTISMIMILFIISVALGKMDYKIFEIIALAIGKIFMIIFNLFGMGKRTGSFIEFVLTNLGLWISMFLIGIIVIKK